jgi:LptD protein
MYQIYARAVPIRVRKFIFFTIAVLIPVCNLLAQDSTKVGKDSLAVKQSSSVLKSKVDYNARDSIRFDVSNQKMYLYGEAIVKYENMQLKAEYIEIDIEKNITFSHGKRDSAGHAVLDTLGRPIGDPSFSDAGKTFDAKELTYNFQTKKGKIREVTTKEGEGYIHAKDAKKDTGDVYYVKTGKYTTCDLENPHFYLNASKIKVIPNDKIITGPAYLVIADVPTPLILPFGVFPNKKGRRSGVIIPAYGESAALGFFLKDGGYYFGINDYFDQTLKGDIYSLGSYNLNSITNYVKRYKYKGYMDIKLGQMQFSEKEFPDYRKNKTFWLVWQHAQDAKLNPTSRFSANVNAGSGTYQTYLTNNINDYLTNTFSSKISWDKSWQGKPYYFSANLGHSQTKRPRLDKKGVETEVNLDAPEITFTRDRWFPFQGKNYTGKPTVFQKIGTSYKLSAQNKITTGDSILFKSKSLTKLRNGLNVNVPISTSMNIGPIIISPSAGINGYGYLQSYRKHFNADSDRVVVDTLNGFKYAYDYNAAVSAGTKLYGMFAFKKGRLKAIRHVISPNASFGFRPDFGQKKYGFYDYVQSNKAGTLQQYSFFENAVNGGPGAGKSGVLSLSLNNSLEMKLRPAKKDTSGQDRKIILIESFGISSSYNIAAETFKWSQTSLYARTRLFKVIDLAYNGSIDPYAYDTSLGRRIDRFQYKVNGEVGRWTQTTANLSVNTDVRNLFRKKSTPLNSQTSPVKQGYKNELAYIQSHPDYYVDFNVPWTMTVSYVVTYSNSFNTNNIKKPVMQDTVIQTLGFSGSVSLTKKWKVGFRSGIDFIRKDFTFTSFDVYRDLHCWEMTLNWIPFGFRKSYMLTIRVKASALQDLKLDRKRNWYDSD